MSQMALIEINYKIENIQEINKFSLDGMTFLTTDHKYQLDFHQEDDTANQKDLQKSQA